MEPPRPWQKKKLVRNLISPAHKGDYSYDGIPEGQVISISLEQLSQAFTHSFLWGGNRPSLLCLFLLIDLRRVLEWKDPHGC